MEQEKHFSTLLWDLGIRVADIVERAVRNGDLAKNKQTYVLTKLDNFDYSKGSWSRRTEFQEAEEWDWHARHKLVEADIGSLAEFDSAAKAISTETGDSIPQSRYWLSRFVLRLMSDPAMPSKGAELNRLIVLFLNDLKKLPQKWSAQVWLRGLRMEIEQIEIARDVILRQPEARDLETKERLEDVLSLYPHDRATSFDYPSAILTFSLMAKNNLTIHYEMTRLMQALRLYRPASISQIMMVESAESILQVGTMTTHPIIPAPQIITSTITSADVSPLPKFVATFKPLVPAEALSGTPVDTDYVTDAMLRFNDSLLSSQVIEGRVATIIMGLEPLLLKSEEREELSERLALRTAKLLYYHGKRPVEVYSNVKRSYEIRSRFIHGGHLTQSERVEANELFQKIIEYTRLALLQFMLLKRDGEDKDSLLPLMTRSLIEPNAEEKLQSILSNSHYNTEQDR